MRHRFPLARWYSTLAVLIAVSSLLAQEQSLTTNAKVPGDVRSAGENANETLLV